MKKAWNESQVTCSHYYKTGSQSLQSTQTFTNNVLDSHLHHINHMLLHDEQEGEGQKEG